MAIRPILPWAAARSNAPAVLNERARGANPKLKTRLACVIDKTAPRLLSRRLGGPDSSPSEPGQTNMRLLLHGILTVLLVSAASFTSAVEFTRVQSARIAHMTGKVLEDIHYRQAPLDDTISEKFLRNYLDALDYNH